MRSFKIMLSQDSKFMQVFSLNMWLQDNFNMFEEKPPPDLRGGGNFLSGFINMIAGE